MGLALPCRTVQTVGRLHPRAMSRFLASLPLALLLAFPVMATGCKSKPTIPGTEIPDSEENRAILLTLERYRTAFVARDAATVLASAHPTYYDSAGTDDPTDDVDYQALGALVRRRFAQLDAVRMTVDYLEVHVHGDRATVKVWIDASYRFKPLLDLEGAPRPQSPYARKQDHARFELLREDGAWLIVSGL
jgi:hypothetical protein